MTENNQMEFLCKSNLTSPEIFIADGIFVEKPLKLIFHAGYCLIRDTMYSGLYIKEYNTWLQSKMLIIFENNGNIIENYCILESEKAWTIFHTMLQALKKDEC